MDREIVEIRQPYATTRGATCVIDNQYDAVDKLAKLLSDHLNLVHLSGFVKKMRTLGRTGEFKPFELILTILNVGPQDHRDWMGVTHLADQVASHLTAPMVTELIEWLLP